MTNILLQIQNDINQAVQIALKLDHLPNIIIESATNFADLTIKVGFMFAKILQQSPEEIASQVSTQLEQYSWIERITNAKGFINIKLHNDILKKLINQVLAQKEKYGSQAQKNIKVQFDYASINPTGPMHAGHLRSAVIADSIVNVFAFLGYQVNREYYLNDTGGQAKKLVEAVYSRYQQLFDINYIFNNDQYAGEYLIDTAKYIQEQLGNTYFQKDLSECYSIFRKLAVEHLLNALKLDLAELDVKHDAYFSEYEMEQDGRINKTLHWLQEQHLVDQIILPAPINYKGPTDNTPVLVLKDDQDDRVKALTKTDGTHTYLLGDIAYHADRYNRGYDYVIDFFGADHIDHAKMLTNIIKKLWPNKRIAITTCQMVRFEQNGQEFKMSKRNGTYITAKEIIQTVGGSAIRMEMLKRTANAQLTIDVDKVLQIDLDNPIYYIQYAHARCVSALNNAQEASEIADYTLNNEYARSALLHILLFEQTLERVVNNLDHHILFDFLYKISTLLHGLYSAGKTDDNLRLRAGSNVTLIQSIQQILFTGLKLLGVQAWDKMPTE